MIHWKQITLQERNSPYIEQLNNFHDLCLILCTSIIILITYLIINNVINTYPDYSTLDSNFLEIFWAIIPILVLLVVALPSLCLLYIIDEDEDTNITIKIIGNQWFWSYEYSDFLNLSFDSYIKPWSNSWDFRLLDVDNRLILPWEFKIRLLITARDVLHAWTVPSLGVRVDAVPGRLNITYIYIDKLGLFFGQCSEICGINHSFIPICIESHKLNYFIHWLKSKI